MRIDRSIKKRLSKTSMSFHEIDRFTRLLKDNDIDEKTIDLESVDSRTKTCEELIDFLSEEYGLSINEGYDDKDYHADAMKISSSAREASDKIKDKSKKTLKRKRPQILTPLKSNIRLYDVFGFDVETIGQKNKFYMGSIVGEDYRKVFYDREEMRQEILTRKFSGKIKMFATNLEFDIFSLFDYDDFPDMKIIHHNSKLIKIQYCKNKQNWHFFDTFNYAHMSVDKMGQVVGIPKLKTPSVGCTSYMHDPDPGEYWRPPMNKFERDELETYNLRDSEITFRFVKFLYDALYKLNTQPKNTIASTAMNCFRRNNLKYNVYQMPRNIIMTMYDGYYGGRCEAIRRGHVKNLHYFDFNSLYPSVMRDFDYPNPNTWQHSKLNRRYYSEFDGMSRVMISSPEDSQYIPFLPLRTPDKLLFPNMNKNNGWYSNIELRKAEEIGYHIHHVHESIYFRENDYYFKDYVDRLYDLRLDYKSQNSPMEFVCKLLLNSLYGKFAMRFNRSERWFHPMQMNEEVYEKYDCFDEVNGMVRCIAEEVRRIPIYVIPIWSVYCTSYARMRLYDAIQKAGNVYYMDTDSIVCDHDFGDSSRLGMLKEEFRIKQGYIVRPKFYAFRPVKAHENRLKNGESVKIKGLNERMGFDDFEEFMFEPSRVVRKFIRFKESFRRNLAVNEIIEFEKTFKMDDTKRLWVSRFTPFETHDSDPITLET